MSAAHAQSIAEFIDFDPFPDWIDPTENTFREHRAHVARLPQALEQPSVGINGVELFVAPTVYHPGAGLSSNFLVEAMRGCQLGNSLLDLGCGSGFVGLSLFVPGRKLVLADVSFEALFSAAENARRLHIQADVLWSDLFSRLEGQRFDSIVFNLPLFHKDIEHEAEQALCDPQGRLLRRFLEEAPAHLSRAGKLFFTASNLMDRDLLQDALAGYDFVVLKSARCSQSDVCRWAVCAKPI